MSKTPKSELELILYTDTVPVGCVMDPLALLCHMVSNMCQSKYLIADIYCIW